VAKPETLMTAEIHIPPILKIGGGSFAEASTVLLHLQCKRPLVVTDPFLMKNQLAERLRTQIQDAGLSCAIFHETVADPTTVVVEAGVRMFVDGGHDSLVSLGGGSPIDTAKAIGMLAANGGRCTLRFRRLPAPGRRSHGSL
jgi:alcohol dehydrogenase class IV